MQMPKELATEYGKNCGVSHTADSLKAVHAFADRCVNDSFFLDKDIYLIDYSGTALSSTMIDIDFSNDHNFNDDDLPIMTEDTLNSVIIK